MLQSSEDVVKLKGENQELKSSLEEKENNITEAVCSMLLCGVFPVLFILLFLLILAICYFFQPKNETLISVIMSVHSFVHAF